MIKIQNPKQRLKHYGIRPSKWLGQYFLTNKTVLEKIITAADLTKQDIVLEIGPGLGVLTIELAKRAKKVIAVEKDRTLSRLLEDILKTKGIKNVKVVNRDILSLELVTNNLTPNPAQRGEPNRHPNPKPLNYKLIANLPYYITSPVIRKFLETEHRPKLMVLMVQKEVAQRIVAQPPRMNILAVAVQFYAQPKIVSYVSKNSFWPIPKVDSAIIKIVPKPIPKINIKKFFNLVKAGFSSKRKMLKNNLNIDESTLEKLGINPRTRAESLPIEQWLKLYCQF